MKRMLPRLLAMLLCLCLAAPAAMADDLLRAEAEEYRNYVNHVVAGDTAYIMTTSGLNATLWRWTSGMTTAEVAAEGLVNASFFYSEEEMTRHYQNQPEVDTAHALSVIFSDGVQLYGFNRVTRQVFAIDVTENGLAYTDVAVLPPVYGNNRGVVHPLQVVRAGDWLLWLETDQNHRTYQERLLAFNLVTGTVKQAILPDMADIAPYKDGQILVLCETDATGQEPYALYTYNPATDAAEHIGTLPKGTSIHKIAYSSAWDMVVYQNQTRIMGWTAENGPEQFGFVPTSSYVDMAVLGDHLLYTSDRVSVEAMQLQRDFATDHSLTLMGGTMYTVLSQFYTRYMDVPVYYANLQPDETYAQVFAREEDRPDLVYLYATNGDFSEMLDSGALMDLSGYAEIAEYVSLLHPAYQELVTRDGGIYGVPMMAYSYNGWYINKEVMQAMGLTAEDIPTSLTELCAFATRWNEEYAQKYPHFTLLNETENYKERLLEEMLTRWADDCQYNGRELTLDDPIFREMMAALEAMQVNKLEAALRQTDPEVSEYKQALIWTGCKDVGNWACYMEEFSDRIFIPLTLTPDTPYIAPVTNVKLWVVNNRSENGDYATALLAEAVEKNSYTQAYVLRTDKTEPIVNEYYASMYAEEMERLSYLEDSLANSVNPATIERRIAEVTESTQNQLARNRYDVFPSAIEHYQKVIAPVSFVALPSVLDADQRTGAMVQCIEDYLNGRYDVDAFIRLMEDAITQQD